MKVPKKVYDELMEAFDPDSNGVIRLSRMLDRPLPLTREYVDRETSTFNYENDLLIDLLIAVKLGKLEYKPEKRYRVKANPNSSKMCFKRFIGKGFYGQLSHWTNIEDNDYWSTADEEEAEAVSKIVGGGVEQYEP